MAIGKFIEYACSENPSLLYSEEQGTYIRCQEKRKDRQVYVGGSTSAGLRVIHNYYIKEKIAVAAVRKFF